MLVYDNNTPLITKKSLPHFFFRQGSRLVEICKHPVTALTHEQMVDLLKTSMTVIGKRKKFSEIHF